jgi:hypothetical protein
MVPHTKSNSIARTAMAPTQTAMAPTQMAKALRERRWCRAKGNCADAKGDGTAVANGDRAARKIKDR